jgi:hypothetical protein
MDHTIFPGSTPRLFGRDRLIGPKPARLWPSSRLRAQTRESRPLAGFRCRLSRGTWPFPSRCGIFSCSACGFDPTWQGRLGLFRSPTMAMVQRLDACRFFFHPQLSVVLFLALVFQVCRNRFGCHGQSVTELSSSELSNFGHSVTNSSAASFRPDLAFFESRLSEHRRTPSTHDLS